MEFGPSSQLFFLDNGATGGDAGLSADNLSMSNLDPHVWVLLRFRSSWSFLEMNDGMGRREGRHASRDSKGLDVSRTFRDIITKTRSCHVLTTDDGSFDLDVRPHENPTPIQLNVVCQTDDRGHCRAGRKAFVSQKALFEL